MDRIKYIVNILIVVLLFFAVAIQRDGKILGNDVTTMLESNNETEEQVDELLSDGTRVIYSSSLAKDIIGFGGRIPLKLYVKDDIIQKVEALPNAETPSFWNEIENSGLLEHWNGKTLAEAASEQVDGVSGATYSAVAVIGNVQRAAQYGANVGASEDSFFANLELKIIIGLLVIILGAFITLKKSKNNTLILVQQILNVVVLGFWCGSFLSLSTFTVWAANGINLSLSLITITMAVVVLLMPLFNRKGSYCHIHCPMGAAQELMGRIPASKLKIKPTVNKFLNKLRYYILWGLLLLMWSGVGFEIMNYEVFSAFVFESASLAVLVMAVLFLALSIFTPRPYCRFICPTGAILTVSQNIKYENEK